MKKALSLLAGAALATTAAFAQLAPGSTAPNWTFTDLNGNSWTLYNLTSQGKTVFIDVSATWCGPCWNYHNSHALRDLYLKHGPSGTCSNSVMVFFIEGDQSTTIADLNGTGSNTQGDWVTGTPYPIIDPGAQTNSFNTNYAIGYFPTVYKVCPDNKIYEVGQLNAEGLEASINTCPFVNDGFVSAGPTALQCATTFAPSITLKNNGSAALTSCNITYSYDANPSQNFNWTGNLASGQTTVVTLPASTFTAGSHTMSVTTSNDDNNANNCKEYTFSVNTAAGAATPLTNNFTSTGFPYTNWLLNNPDGGITWARASTNGGSMKLDCYNYGSVGEVDEFVVEPVDMSTMTSATLQFNVAHAQYSSSYTDALEVLISSDCGATWTSVWSKSGATLATVPATTSAFTPTAAQWRPECVDLSNYIGQNKVFVMFRATNGYGNNIYVDDINISNAACPTSIAENNSNVAGVNVYPNPADNSANIAVELNQASDVVINVYNAVGQLVVSNNYGQLASGKQIIELNTAALSNGIYMIEIVAGNNKTVSRISVSH
ncbi:MAG: hypothetical protein Fur0041_04240 [Bacteroidia bacterium]